MSGGDRKPGATGSSSKQDVKSKNVKSTPLSPRKENGGGSSSSQTKPKLVKSKEELDLDFSDALEGPKPGLIALEDAKRLKFIDVVVFNVVGPHNFFVRNYRQKEILRMLEEEMTAFYENYIIGKYDTEVVPGGYYAAKMDWGRWARVKITSPHIRDPSNISVTAIDHGNCFSIDKSKLCPLRKNYVKRLPVQAYEASLYKIGSEPPTPETCSKFKKETENKAYVAIRLGAREVFKVSVYTVVLIDTSGPKDNYIHLAYAKNDIVKSVTETEFAVSSKKVNKVGG